MDVHTWDAFGQTSVSGSPPSSTTSVFVETVCSDWFTGVFQVRHHHGRCLYRSGPPLDHGKVDTSGKGNVFFSLVTELDYCLVHPGQAKDQDLNTFTESDLKTLSSHQIVEFLSLLLQEVKVSESMSSSCPCLSSDRPVDCFAPSGSSSFDSREEDAGGVRPQRLYECGDPLQVRG